MLMRRDSGGLTDLPRFFGAGEPTTSAMYPRRFAEPNASDAGVGNGVNCTVLRCRRGRIQRSAGPNGRKTDSTDDVVHIHGLHEAAAAALVAIAADRLSGNGAIDKMQFWATYTLRIFWR
jgi:hypothetical protein